MEEFNIGTLPIPQKASNAHTMDKRMKMFVDVSLDLSDKVSLYSVKHNMKKQEILLQALQNFMANKSVKSRPEAVKQRKKRGKKPRY